MKKRKLFLIFSLVSFFAIGFAQKTESGVDTITIDDQLRIVLNEGQEIRGNYTLNISHLAFQSEQALNEFCKAFSLDFHHLIGDFNSKEITLTLDLEKLSARKWSISNVNDHFDQISRRMRYRFNRLK